MKNKSIFSYDKTPNCDYCKFNENGCSLKSEVKPCSEFEYDVFKRKPVKSPKLAGFSAKDFEI